MINLEYEYRLVTGEVKIKTPFAKDLSEIQKILIEKRDNYIKQISIYPNGFIFYSDLTATGIVIRTNFPLKENEDGTFDVVL
jgi:hypothetical protein